MTSSDSYEITFERIDSQPFDLDATGGNFSKRFRAFHGKLMKIYGPILDTLPTGVEPLGIAFCGILVRHDDNTNSVAIGVVDGEPVYIPCKAEPWGQVIAVIGLDDDKD